MSTTESTPKFTVTFDEPDSIARVKRPWHELYPDALAYVDGVLDAYVANFGSEKPIAVVDDKGNPVKDDKGKPKTVAFSRKLSNLDIPLERDSENPEMRAVRLFNDRCSSRNLNVHAAIKGGKVHLVNGKRVVKPRQKRTADNGSENAASE